MRMVWTVCCLCAAVLLAVPPVGAVSRVVLKVAEGEVVILRDEYGVPHVFGPTERAVFYGNGYAIAQDRMAQMEKYRRAARGEMAELVGSSAVEADRETRREGYTEAEREAQVRRLPKALQTALQAYADGVNACLAEWEKGSLPSEVKKLGVAIRPWKSTDTIAIGQMMARRFGGDDGGELRNLEVLNLIKFRFGDQAMGIFNDLLWKNDPAAPTTIPADEGGRGDAETRRRGDAETRRRGDAGRDDTRTERRQDGVDEKAPARVRPSFALNPSFPASPRLRVSASPRLRVSASPRPPISPHLTTADRRVIRAAIRSLSREAQRELALRHGLPTKLGSYAIVVAPQKSASGNAILVGGPQMGFATPQIAHEIHLSSPGLNVIGMGFAGIPGVLIGRNERLAWTTTTGVGDQTDIFVEELNPENKRQYRFKGKWRDMEKRVETIAVRGAEPVTLEVFRTVHGPVVRFDEANNRAYSQSATYWDREEGALNAIYDFNHARNIREFGTAAAKVATSHNWFCATQEGDIGFWFAGRAPIRAEGIDARLPTPGTGEHEWKGIRPFAEMPQIVNPRQGWLGNWNNKPAVWWDNSDTPAWGAIFRVQRIHERLAEKPLLTLEDVKSILPDIGLNDPNAKPLKPFLIEAVRGAGPAADARMREAARLLEVWDNHAVEGSVAKTLFDTWLQELRLVIFADEIGLAVIPPDVERALQPSVILHVLEGKNGSLVLSRDYLNGKSPADASLEALKRALDRLTRERGPQMNLWTYRQPRTRLAPLPDIPAYSRGTYLLIAELSKPQIRSESLLPPGQSEDPASPHYSDQRELASWWMYKPHITDRETLEKLVGASGKKD